MRLVIELPDDIVIECEQRAGDWTWSELVARALTFAMSEADAAEGELTEAELPIPTIRGSLTTIPRWVDRWALRPWIAGQLVGPVDCS